MKKLVRVAVLGALALAVVSSCSLVPGSIRGTWEHAFSTLFNYTETLEFGCSKFVLTWSGDLIGTMECSYVEADEAAGTILMSVDAASGNVTLLGFAVGDPVYLIYEIDGDYLYYAIGDTDYPGSVGSTVYTRS